MTSQANALSVLVALEFVVMSLLLFFIVPLDAIVWVVPLFVVLLVALLLYRY